MEITSSVFAAGQEIPRHYTCAGADRSPPLEWKDVPTSAKSLVLIVDDPDAPDPAAPKRTWVHWVVYNLPASAGTLAEGGGNAAMAPPAMSGLNDWSRPGYGGPCPPIGRHRYFFKLYALDTVLDEIPKATKAVVEAAMQGHVLARAELVGTFAKPFDQD